MSKFDTSSYNLRSARGRWPTAITGAAGHGVRLFSHVPAVRRRWLVVTEFPKSGGNWLCSMLASYFDLSFPREYFLPPVMPAVMKGHWMTSQIRSADVCLCRDGRDVAVSLFFHYRARAERLGRSKTGALLEDRLGSAWWKAEPEEVIPKFFPLVFSDDCPVGESWQRFNARWLDRGLVLVTYEDLVEDPYSALARCIAEVTGDVEVDEVKLEIAVRRFDFQLLSGRDPGHADNSSFYRQGRPGGWRQYLSTEDSEIFRKAADELAPALVFG